MVINLRLVPIVPFLPAGEHYEEDSVCSEYLGHELEEELNEVKAYTCTRALVNLLTVLVAP